jgi:hypothetical protein
MRVKIVVVALTATFVTILSESSERAIDHCRLISDRAEVRSHVTGGGVGGPAEVV